MEVLKLDEAEYMSKRDDLNTFGGLRRKLFVSLNKT